jgi:hypothetical protein
MTAIVTSTYRYKRPPRKRKAVALEVPAIVTAKTPKPVQGPVLKRVPAPEAAANDVNTPMAPAATAHDDRRLEGGSPEIRRTSAIVTARKPGKRYSNAPDMTPEEHQRRGDGADAMFREFKRLIAERGR